MTDPPNAEPAATSALMPWLKLMRLPTVFTALANILCGYFISSSERDLTKLVAEPQFWLLLLSSAGLYLGGMVLNDVFDARLDAEERPNRPIPSGRISQRSAAVFAAVLMIIGVAAAGAVSVLTASGSVTLAIILAAAVLLYDGLLKNTMLAPLGMGTCRCLNIMLGASSITSFADLWTGPQLPVAMGMGIYVFGVTWFAQNEAGTSSRRLLYAGCVCALIGLASNASIAWRLMAQSTAATGTLIALGLIAANIFRRCVRAIQKNQPIVLQKTVGFMLVNIIFIDAAMTFCLTGSDRLAAVVVILVIPAMLMKRIIPMS